MNGDVKVIYIMGAGRSGSTIFDAVLGSHPDMIGFGELNNMHRQAWLRREYCACGQPAPSCPFWSELRRRWLGDGDEDVVRRQAQLEQALERVPRWIEPIRRRTVRSSKFGAYAERLRALFEHLRDLGGSEVVVDSSKDPARALALGHVPGLDVRVVHLVRDPRGVVWSLRKKLARNLEEGVPKDTRVQPVWWSAASWGLTNLEAEWVRRQLPAERSIRLRYEDFVTDPTTALERVGALLERDMSPLAPVVTGELDLSERHQVAGNRLRMQRTARLRIDEAWRGGLSPADVRSCNRIAGPLMRRYGYDGAEVATVSAGASG